MNKFSEFNILYKESFSCAFVLIITLSLKIFFNSITTVSSLLFSLELSDTTKLKIVEGDFLKLDLNKFENNISIIGNFPYNISSQILFKAFDNRDKVTEVVGMFQKEVAERIACIKGKKKGILSVLLQAFYDIEYCFEVDNYLFDPAPKVKSGVIKMKRNSRKKLECDEKIFIKIVKAGYNQRRKTLRNSLKSFTLNSNSEIEILLQKRAEQLDVEEFIFLTKNVQ